MGYQALLFCPDEKTARTVTQVLSELDFTVVPCTEPFAAVKKLMAEHFDAVVVDCDNEQNATLLFKSARNTANNQSSLAVAVVEGQAGVAKAFRIGANLVLTKPINVEQAKGTLRVARGLLRKNDTAKSAAPAPTKPVNQTPIAAAPARPATPIAPLAVSAAASAASQRPVQKPTVVASASPEIAGDDELFEATIEDTTVEEVSAPRVTKPVSQTLAPKISAASTSPAEPKTKTDTAAVKPQPSASSSSVSSPGPIGFGTGAASAPAPARETKPNISIDAKPSTATAPAESKATEDAIAQSASSADETSATAAAFTFGGNVSEQAAPAGGGSKKALLAVAAVVVIAALGYAVWFQWVRSSGAEVSPIHVSSQPVKAPAAAPAPASAASVATNSPASSTAPSTTSAAPSSSVTASTPDEAAAPSTTKTTKASSSADSTASIPAHKGKSADEDSSSPSPAESTKGSTKPEEQPIMIKSGPAKPRAKSEDSADAAAPSLAAIPSATSSAALPNLGAASKAPTPVLQTLHVSQGVSRGLLIKQVQPTYPPNALRLRIEGSVELLATISKNGDISAVKVLSGDPQLARAAGDAVKQWKYKAYLLNGEPVEIQTQITMNFKLPK